VVKRHHRRALITLARHAPSVHTMYALDYLSPLETRRVQKELDYVDRLGAEGVDLLRRTPSGWRRSDPST
ncbi:MAG TPA: hypothetical protein VK866_05630, partial [Acidimicrobiales bacterium]|nr:hypothetical protein [Acidimicrobiales bacterium]